MKPSPRARLSPRKEGGRSEASPIPRCGAANSAGGNSRKKPMGSKKKIAALGGYLEKKLPDSKLKKQGKEGLTGNYLLSISS